MTKSFQKKISFFIIGLLLAISTESFRSAGSYTPVPPMIAISAEIVCIVVFWVKPLYAFGFLPDSQFLTHSRALRDSWIFRPSFLH